MPRYHFQVLDGLDMPDTEGTDLRDLAAARQCALKTAGDLLKEGGEHFWSGKEWRMIVTDALGLTLLTLTVVGNAEAANDDGPPTPAMNSLGTR